MFIFLMNPQKWWHIGIMWTRSPFNVYNSEWVWAICNPDQTRKETNQKLQGSVTSIKLRIWSLLFKGSESSLVSGCIMLPSFLLNLTDYINRTVLLRNCLFYVPPKSICWVISILRCLFHLIYVFSFFLSVPASVQSQPHMPIYTHTPLYITATDEQINYSHFPFNMN